jgi:phytoene synthase
MSATSLGMPRTVLAEARSTTHKVARTFALATRLLPRSVRSDVYLLYLACRRLDDLVDEGHPAAAERLATVEAWTRGQPSYCPEVEILECLRRRHPELPLEAVREFCRGQAQDLHFQGFETEDQLDLYAYRVAGTVGQLMASLLGARGEAADSAARALGIAMQRTNIIRDVDEDLARGRVYLPRSTMRMAGVEDLDGDDRALLLRLEIAIADHWYDRGLPGCSLLPAGGRQVRAAGLMYREILREVERSGRGLKRPLRVSVPPRRKVIPLVRALIAPS